MVQTCLILQKLHVWEKSGSSVKAQNALIQSDSRILYYDYIQKELINIVNFVYGDDHQGNVAYDTFTFWWLWPDMSL